MITKNDSAHYTRALEQLQEVNGGPCAFVAGEPDKQRFTRWLGESLAWALAEQQAGRYREAMRGLLQAREYLGRIGGFWPSPIAHDAAIALQNELESRLGGT